MNRSANKRPVFILFFIGLFLLASAAVMLLWNYALRPAVSGIAPIAYWQAMGLLLLSRILFGGFRPGSQGGQMHGKKPPFFKEKWMNMTDEERLRFKEEWKKRCGK